MVPTSEFEDLRPQLTAMAFRMLGSIHDAEDAVQSTWLNSLRVDGTEIRNPAAWLTTTLTRVCLDQLRARGRRQEIRCSPTLSPRRLSRPTSSTCSARTCHVR